MLLVQSLPLHDSFLKMLILQSEKELKSIDCFFDLSIKEDDEIDSSNLNPIAVLLGIQKYSIEQFRNDMLTLIGYSETSTSSSKKQKKKKLLSHIENSIKNIKSDVECNFSDEYVECLNNWKKDYLPEGHEPLLLIIQQMIKSMFLLKANFLSEQLLKEYEDKVSKDLATQVKYLFNDYRLFLKYKIRDFKKELNLAVELNKKLFEEFKASK
jgi:hypothetical protein